MNTLSNESAIVTKVIAIPQKRLIFLTHAMYAIQAIAYFEGIIFSLIGFINYMTHAVVPNPPFILSRLIATVAVIITYLKYSKVKNTWLESHFRWQIRTFWWGLLWGAMGIVLAFGSFIGGMYLTHFGSLLKVIGLIVSIPFFFIASLLPLILFIFYVWLLFRIIRGWLSLKNKQPVVIDEMKS